MKSRTLFILAVILLAVASLYPGAAMAQSAAEQEITELEQKMNAAYAANDLPTYFAFYSKDFTQWLPEGRTNPSSVREDVDRVHQEWRGCCVGRDFRYAYTDRPERRYRGCELPASRQDPLPKEKRSRRRDVSGVGCLVQARWSLESCSPALFTRAQEKIVTPHFGAFHE
jgi:hypothetical protein